MIKLENTVLPSPDQWKAIIFGARNPLNSWDRSDSFCVPTSDNCNGCHDYDKCAYIFEQNGKPYRSNIGPNDLDLMKRLRNAGTDHRKFMRMITVYVDITAPLYWWKEFDTYKVGTVANSCSTMHKIHDKEFTLEDFSCEYLIDSVPEELEWESNHEVPNGVTVWTYDDTGYLAITARGNYHEGHSYKDTLLVTQKDILDMFVIPALNANREAYLKTKDKKYWWQMIQLLPSSYNQKRTVMLNYEVLANMYKSRKGHKLDEWKDLCTWVKTLPYSELITGEFNEA